MYHTTYHTTSRLRQNSRHFADDISKCIFLNYNIRILNRISLKYVPYGSVTVHICKTWPWRVDTLIVRLRKHKYAFSFYIIAPRGHNAGSQSSLKWKTRTSFILYTQYHSNWCPDNTRSTHLPAGVLRSIGYLSETHLKLKSREISFVHNICLKNPIVLDFCTQHGSITVVLCVKFQNDWTNATNVMDERDFARFEFEMSFDWISHIASGSSGIVRPRHKTDNQIYDKLLYFKCYAELVIFLHSVVVYSQKSTQLRDINIVGMNMKYRSG